MSSRCLPIFVVALSAFTSAVAQEISLPGDPPQFFVVTAVDDNGLVIQRRPLSSKEIDVPNIVYKPTFKQLRATDGKGKTLSAEEVKRRIKRGSVVLVSPDEQPVDSIYLTVVKEDTLILLDIFPRKGATGIQAGE